MYTKTSIRIPSLFEAALASLGILFLATCAHAAGVPWINALGGKWSVGTLTADVINLGTMKGLSGAVGRKG